MFFPLESQAKAATDPMAGKAGGWFLRRQIPHTHHVVAAAAGQLPFAAEAQR